MMLKSCLSVSISAGHLQEPIFYLNYIRRNDVIGHVYLANSANWLELFIQVPETTHFIAYSEGLKRYFISHVQVHNRSFLTWKILHLQLI